MKMSGPEDVAEVAEALQAAGMTQEEAKVYVHLLRTGPEKVGQLVQYFDVSRAKLYRLLDALARKGFVSKTPERPTFYHPVIPEEAFELGRARLDRELEHLREKREETLGALQRLHRADDQPEPTSWNKVEGTSQIYDVVQRMVGEAEESIWLASNHELSASPWLPAIEETWSVARQRTDEGVVLRVLLGPTARAFEKVPDWIPRDRSSARVFELPHKAHFVLVDERSLLCWVQIAPPRSTSRLENVAVHTDADTLVGTHATLFNSLWGSATAPRQGRDPEPALPPEP